MRYSTPLLAAVGTVAGLLTAAVGYHVVAPADAARTTSNDPVSAVGRPLPAGPPRVSVVLAPCEPPATLRKDVCVTHVWRTVTAPPEPAPAIASGGARSDDRAGVHVGVPGISRGDDHGEDRGDDRGEDHGHDRGDDDHGAD